MTELLSRDEWRATYLRWCPGCDCDTLPLHTGRCGFCDLQLKEPDEDGPPIEYGVCALDGCGELFERGPHGGKLKQYCCESHRKQGWFKQTASGIKSRERNNSLRNVRRNKQRDAWRAQGLNSRGLPRAA